MKRFLCMMIVVVLLAGTTVLPAAAATPAYRTWLQSDPRWGSMPFGTTDTLSKSGCAITSIAKLLVHSGAVTTDEKVFNPGVYCTWLKANGGLTSQGWLVWAKAAEYSSKFSYHGAVSFGSNETTSQKTQVIKSYVDDGYVVVVQVKNGGHYVAVDKVSGGTVYIMDPANTGYTKLFDYPASGVEKIQIYKGPHNGSGSLNNTTTYDTTVDPVGAGSYCITSDDGVNLRSGVGTSHSILTAIPYNTTVQVTKVQDGWGYTTYNGQKGWFTLEFAKLTKNSVRGVQIKKPTKLTYQQGEALDTAGMTVTALYVDGTSKTIQKDYTLSGFSSEKAGTVKVYVTYQGKSAVFSVTIQAKTYKPGVYVINSSDGVNLREKGSTDGKLLTAMPDKTRLTVTEVKGNWGKTVYGEYTGWFCLDYANFLEKEESKPVGIAVTAKQPNILAGATPAPADFTVKYLYDDGTTAPVKEFDLLVGTLTKEGLPVTVTVEKFSKTVLLNVFAAIPAGDCNFSGKVDAADALSVLQFSVGKQPGRFHDTAADVNGDSRIDANDALQILRLVVGKIPSFNAGATPTDATPIGVEK